MRKLFIIFTFLYFFQIISAKTFDYYVDKPSSMYIGTPFHVIMELETSLQDSIFIPPVDTLDIFILKGEIKTEETIEDNKVTSTINYTFQPFDVGEYTFPKLEVNVKKLNGKIESYKTNEFLVMIKSIVPDSTNVIKDIASPVSLRLGLWDYILILLLIVILIGLIYLLRKLFRKKPKKVEKDIVVDTRPAHEIALEMLHKLKNEKLLDKGQFLEYHFQLSYILRFFVEHFYRISAVEMTTTEIRESLQLADHKEKSLILDFLLFADRIKFAKFTPSLEDSDKAYTWLYNYLSSFHNKIEKEGSNA